MCEIFLLDDVEVVLKISQCVCLRKFGGIFLCLFWGVGVGVGRGVYTSECLMSRCVYSGSFPLNSKTFDSIAKHNSFDVEVILPKATSVSVFEKQSGHHGVMF